MKRFEVVDDFEPPDPASVHRIYMYKRDLFTIDQICFRIVLIDGTEVYMNEDQRRYKEAMELLCENLPGFLDSWTPFRNQPVFHMPETLVYERFSEIA